jgi:hypothetical protein
VCAEDSEILNDEEDCDLDTDEIKAGKVAAAGVTA